MTARLLPAIFTLEVRKMFAYRGDFWIQFIGGFLAQFVVAFFLWKAIFLYRGAAEIGQYSFRGMMLYYVLVPIIARATRGVALGNMAHDIYEGTLTRYIVYPVSVFMFKLAVHMAHTIVFLLQGIVALCIFLLVTGYDSHTPLTLSHLWMGVSATLLATILHFILITLIELTAFWADNVWSLVVIVRFITGLLGGGMLPLTLFPEKLQPLLNYLPFTYLIGFPVQCLMGRVTLAEWAQAMVMMVAWCVLFSLLYSAVWSRGKYRYTGVGI